MVSITAIGCLPTAGLAQIVVTEVMYNPSDENAWEWIEVINTGSKPVDMNGYLAFNLGDMDVPMPQAAINGSIDTETVIGPDEIAIIYDGFYEFDHPSNFADQKFREAWGLSSSVKLIGANFFPSLTNVAGHPGQSIGFWASDADWKLDQTLVEVDPVNNPGVLVNVTTSFANAAFGLDFSGGAFPTVDGASSIAWTGRGSNQVGANWYQSVSGANGATTSVPVTYAGAVNSTNDVGNPGVVPPGVPAVAGLHITEIMYDAASPEDDWEWIEIYNSSASAVDLSGYVLDDNNLTPVTTANITAGNIPAGGTAILFNREDITAVDFAAAWGASLNLIPVAEWGALGLNNIGDQVSLWNSYSAYSGNHQTHAGAVVTQAFLESNGFPNQANGPSIFWADLSFPASNSSSWLNSATGDGFGSFHPTSLPAMRILHPGGDVSSPGTFDRLVPEPAALTVLGMVTLVALCKRP